MKRNKMIVVAAFCLSVCNINVQLNKAIATDNATDQLQKIQQRGYLIVAVKDNLRPLSFRDANKFRGLEIDLAQRLAQDLLGVNAVHGTPACIAGACVDFVKPLGNSATVPHGARAAGFRLQPVANQDRFSVVVENKVDLAIANVTATASRSRIVDFSTPYYFDGTALITKEPAIQQLRDLGNQQIAVLKGSSTISTVRYVLPTARLVGVDSYAKALALLQIGGAVAFAADASVLTGWVQEYPQYRMLPTVLSAEPLAVVIPKGVAYNRLRQRVNAAIARYWAEGWLQQRAAAWGLPARNSKPQF